MANLKVEVLDAIVDGQGKGAVLEVEAKTAQHLASIGYVRVVDETKAETKAEDKTPDEDAKPAKSKRK